MEKVLKEKIAVTKKCIKDAIYIPVPNVHTPMAIRAVCVVLPLAPILPILPDMTT